MDWVGPAGDALVYALVDTGADEVILPDRLIGRLGAALRPGDHATITALGGGAVPVRYETVDLEISRPGVAGRWSARVGYHAGGKAILGLIGLLDHFTATFNGARRQLTLTPKGTAPAPTMTTPLLPQPCEGAPALPGDYSPANAKAPPDAPMGPHNRYHAERRGRNILRRPPQLAEVVESEAGASARSRGRNWTT